MFQNWVTDNCTCGESSRKIFFISIQSINSRPLLLLISPYQKKCFFFVHVIYSCNIQSDICRFCWHIAFAHTHEYIPSSVVFVSVYSRSMAGNSSGISNCVKDSAADTVVSGYRDRQLSVVSSTGSESKRAMNWGPIFTNSISSTEMKHLSALLIGHKWARQHFFVSEILQLVFSSKAVFRNGWTKVRLKLTVRNAGYLIAETPMIVTSSDHWNAFISRLLRKGSVFFEKSPSQSNTLRRHVRGGAFEHFYIRKDWYAWEWITNETAFC